MFSRFRIVASRIRGLFSSRHLDADFQQELASHLAMLEEENLRRGLPPGEARRQARLRLGADAPLRETHHDLRTLPWLESLMQDVRFGLRILRKSPGFTAVAILTLALGLEVNTAIFSLINGFLLRPLPVAHPEQIVALAVQANDSPAGALGLSYPEFLDFREKDRAFSDVFANVLSTVSLQANEKTDQMPISYVSSNFFTALGLRPVLGRLIAAGDGEDPGQTPALILSYSFWKGRFGGDPSIINEQVRVNGNAATVIGVAPKSFHGMFSPFEMDGYLPLASLPLEESSERFMTDRGARRILAFGRLKQHVGLRQAQSSLNVISSELARQYPATDGGILIRAVPEKLARPQPYANSVFLLIGALFLAFAVLILVLSCLNVTNVVFARAFARKREMAVRSALGASRSRLIRQLLTETLLLAFLGAAGGLGLAELLARAMPSVRLPNFPLVLDFSFDWRVYAYALSAAVTAGIMSGLPAAISASRSDINSALHHSSALRGGVLKKGLHGDLVAAQIACSLALLVGAGLLFRSLQQVESTNLGFDPRNLLNVTINFAPTGYSEERSLALYRSLTESLRALPGVQSVSLAANVPIGSFPTRTPVFGPSSSLNPDEHPPSVLYNVVGPAYFSTMKIPLLQGRGFASMDRSTAPLVAVVNRTMATQFWPRTNPIGKSFRLQKANGQLVQVVGVAQDGKYQTVTEGSQPYFYMPLEQHYVSHSVLEIRCRVPPQSISAVIEQQIHALAPTLSIEDLRTMDQSLQGGSGYFLFRLGAALAGQMGFLSLLLSAAGVYGVISFAVTQRTHEIGIRMALGANPTAILAMVLRQALLLIGAGLLAGLTGAWALGRAMAHILVGVGPTDLATFTAATSTLLCLALLASYIPARRAMHVDPMVALRHE
ncbi:MAG: ADOP family duplicated permease [Candidatus Acidiferrales bacterium]